MDLGAGRVDAALEEDLGAHQLVGEILDSKRYSGVMKPGRGKPHRSCSVRCISGGIPPLFIAENSDGESVIFLLQDARGAAPGREILDWVAKPVRLRGRSDAGARPDLGLKPDADRKLEARRDQRPLARP